MKKKLLYLSLVALLALSACGSAMNKNAAPSVAVNDYGYEMAEEMGIAEHSMAAEPITAESEGTQERMVIQTADLRVSVADTVLAMNETSALAKRLGGYVVSSDRYTTSNNSEPIHAPIFISAFRQKSLKKRWKPCGRCLRPEKTDFERKSLR